MIQKHDIELLYPEVFFQMSEIKIMLNPVDMSEFAPKQACRRISDETNHNFMKTLGKIERDSFDRKKATTRLMENLVL